MFGDIQEDLSKKVNKMSSKERESDMQRSQSRICQCGRSTVNNPELHKSPGRGQIKLSLVV